MSEFDLWIPNQVGNDSLTVRMIVFLFSGDRVLLAIGAQYFPIVFFVFLGLVMGGVLMIAGRVIGRHNPDAAKNSPYECGFEEFADARMKFDVRYYLIAILFILFDLEIAFLFPWALVFRDLKLYGFMVMLIFLAILIAGFVYVWKKGALEWE